MVIYNNLYLMEYKVEKGSKSVKHELQTTPNIQQLNDYIKLDIPDEDYDSGSDPIPVVNFDNELKYIHQVKSVDILFIVDTTQSMAPYLEGIKKWIRKLARDAQKCMSQYITDEEVLAYGLILYRDHPPQDSTYVTKCMQLTTNYLIFKQAVNEMQADGGGDEPEAVLDALYDASYSIHWRKNSQKFIYHILDSPPHGLEFNYCDLTDAFANGCPCGKSWEDVLLKVRENEIDYTVIKLSSNIDKMILKFSEYIRVDVATPYINFDGSKEYEKQNS
jgi:hypothetical protein